MNTVRGRIVVVQEQAFRLLAPDGRTLHLTLGSAGPPFPSDLSRYRDAGLEVEVEYEGEPGTSTANASSLRPT